MATGEQKEKGQEAAKVGRMLWQFSRQKAAPWPGTAINLATGTDAVGNPANLKFEKPTSLAAIHNMSEQNQLIRMIEPMIVGDTIDALEMDGWLGVAKTAPGLAGFGVQTYQPKGAPGRGLGGNPYGGSSSPYGGNARPY